MKYTVVWHPTALDRLAELWLDASDRQSVANASDEIDRQLAIHPDSVGESREHIVRIFFVRPLAVRYFISANDRLDYVISVWRTHAS
jgi:hypothetical protein